MINIPFLLVRIDSENHDDSTLSRRLLTEIVRETDEGSFTSKAIPDRAGSSEKEILARRTGIVEHAGVLGRVVISVALYRRRCVVVSGTKVKKVKS